MGSQHRGPNANSATDASPCGQAPIKSDVVPWSRAGIAHSSILPLIQGAEATVVRPSDPSVAIQTSQAGPHWKEESCTQC
jgi:hypothetical protein